MINITQGENKTFTIKIRDQDGDPFDLTNFDLFKVCLPNASGSKIEISEVANANGSVVAVLGNPILGKLEVTLDNVDTSLLAADDRQDIGIVLDNSSSANPKPKNSEGVLNVAAAVCL